MKHVVMGTAGHVDHGKTTLVKRLTGIDTDRLEEEKRRGMTIELGFAPFHLPGGIEVSIIDVPGHEKFVKTMVSGVTGIDFVMLVVAADEGVMPQTREHIDILSLLNIDLGVIAVTKSDLVDGDWLELIKEDLKSALKGTTLEGAPVVTVSSLTGEGIDTLVKQIELIVREAGSSTPSELFRLPVDRSFTMSGHGTVITGTVSGGKISKGDMVEIIPRGVSARIRGVQVHGKYVDTAEAGDRCALNLAGVEKADVERGDVVVFTDSVQPTLLVDAMLHTVKGEGGISHNQRVHIHVGTKELLGRIRVIGADTIPQGAKGYVQLRFEEPAAAVRGDRFIIRSYSPVRTLGGGKIIFHSVQNRPRFDGESLDVMKLEEQGKNDDIIMYILGNSTKPLSLNELWKGIFIDRDEITTVLENLIKNNYAIMLKETKKYLSINNFDKFLEAIYEYFDNMYGKYQFRFKVDKEEMRSKLFAYMDGKDFTALINSFIENNKLEQNSNFLMQPGSELIEKIHSKYEVKAIEQAFFQDGVNPRRLQQVMQDVSVEPALGMEAAEFLLQIGSLVDMGDDILIHSTILKEIAAKVKEILDCSGSTTAGEVRDKIGTGRKLAIALMEFLDKKGFTRRVEDRRFPGPNFSEFFETLKK